MPGGSLKSVWVKKLSNILTVLITESAKTKCERKSSTLSLKKPSDGTNKSRTPFSRLGTISSIVEPISVRKLPILEPKPVKPCVKDEIVLLKPCVIPLKMPLIPSRMELSSKFPLSSDL